MNRLTKLALRLLGVRIKRGEPPGPAFLPASLFKAGGTGNLMTDGIQLSFVKGVVTKLQVNDVWYDVTPSKPAEP